MPRSGNSSKGIQVILPNFTALPVPGLRLLWKDLNVGQGRSEKNPQSPQKLLLIEIMVHWRDADNKEHNFGVGLRYQTSQTLYAIPTGGWAKFRQCEQTLPKIAYVPPFVCPSPTRDVQVDQEAIRQHAVAAMNITQQAKLALAQADANSAGVGGSTAPGNMALLDGVRKFVNVRDLDIDLIDRINPFDAAYAVLAKAMDEKSLRQVQAALHARRQHC